VLAGSGEIQLEQIGDGEGWLAEGPGGVAVGSVSDAVRGAAAADADPDWIGAVIAAIERELAVGDRRSMLLVKRATGVWFHATRSEKRESIRRHGLDWRRMGSVPGIAGSTKPEWPGVFLCSSLGSARWFARMPQSGQADIWAVHLRNVWLEGAPAASGGGDDGWMICPEPNGRRQLQLFERDITCGR